MDQHCKADKMNKPSFCIYRLASNFSTSKSLLVQGRYGKQINNTKINTDNRR